MIRQKTVTIIKECSDYWIQGRACSGTYLSAPCGKSPLDKDLDDGWIVKSLWEDKYLIVFLLEKSA